MQLAALAYRGLTLLLALLAVVGQATLLDALVRRGIGIGTPGVGGVRPALLSAVITAAAVSLVAGGLGVSMALRSDPRPGTRPLGLALAVWAYLLAYSGMVVAFAPAPDASLRPFFDAHFLVVEALGLGALIRFATLFPKPLRPADVRPPSTLRAGLGAVQRARQWLLRPTAPWLAALAALVLVLVVNAAVGRHVEDAALLPLTDLMRLLALALVVVNLRRSYLLGASAERTRMTWVILGFALLAGTVALVLGGNVLAAATGWAIPGFSWRPALLHFGVIGLMWGAAMGVFYGGPADPGSLVRHVAVLAGMATLALFLAAGLEILFASGTVGAPSSMPRGTGTLLALVVTAVVYGRTRRPLEGFLAQPWVEPRPTMHAEP